MSGGWGELRGSQNNPSNCHALGYLTGLNENICFGPRMGKSRGIDLEASSLLARPNMARAQYRLERKNYRQRSYSDVAPEYY